MNKVEIMYHQYKEGAITEEQLVQNLLGIMMASSETEHLFEQENDLIHLRKQQSMNIDITNYIFNIQLDMCTVMGNIKINKEFGSVLR